MITSTIMAALTITGWTFLTVTAVYLYIAIIRCGFLAFFTGCAFFAVVLFVCFMVGICKPVVNAIHPGTCFVSSLTYNGGGHNAH